MTSTLRMGWIALALCVAGGLFASGAEAGGPPSMSLYAGYGKMMEDGGPDGSFAFRGNAFMMMDPVIGLGAELGYTWLGTQPVDPLVPALGDLDQSVYHITANIRARGMTGSIRPYGIGGLGLYGLHASAGGASDTQTKFGFNLGGGIMHRFADSSTGLGIEARWHMVPNGVVDSGGNESMLDMLTVTAGVDFN